MDEQSQKPTRMDPRKKNTLIIIFKLLKYHRSKGEQSNFMSLLHLEKLLYISLDFMDEYVTFNKSSVGAALDQLPFGFTQEFQDFIQTINKKTMDAFNSNGNDEQVNLIIKAVDLLMTKSLAKYIHPIQVLGQCKVLTFNNLACIYKKRKKHALALKAVNFALEIEQRLLNEKYGDAEINMLSTLLNKVAILSQSNKHDKAIDILNDILSRLGKLSQTPIQTIKQEDQMDSLALQQGTQETSLKYIRMITHYNLGVENEYLYFSERAVSNYNIAHQLATETNNNEVALRIEDALKKFQQK